MAGHTEICPGRGYGEPPAGGKRGEQETDVLIRRGKLRRIEEMVAIRMLQGRGLVLLGHGARVNFLVAKLPHEEVDTQLP